MDVPKTIDHIKIMIKMPNSSQEPPPSSKAQMMAQRTHMFFAPSKSRYSAKIRIMGISKTSDHIKIKIKMQNPSQELLASSKAPNQDLNEMEVLFPFKTKIDKKIGSSVYQRPGTMSKSISRCKNPVKKLQRPPRPKIRTLRTLMFLTSSK